jgi:hypothetical protein
VAVEAPLEAITDVLARHDEVRALFDHGWIHLWALDDTGAVAHRYAGELRWETVDEWAASARRSGADRAGSPDALDGTAA